MDKNIERSINQLVEAIEQNTETYIVNGVEDIVKLQYIACELEDLSNYERNEVYDLLLSIQNNIDYTIDQNLCQMSFVRLVDIDKHLTKLKEIVK